MKAHSDKARSDEVRSDDAALLNTERPPQPDPDVDAQPYWEALEGDQLALPRCAACERWQFPPLERCRRCGNRLVFAPIGGAGTIHTFIVEHHKVAPGFDALRPYAIALVTPDEAPNVRLPGRVLATNTAAVHVGARVQAEIVPLAGGTKRVVAFRLAGETIGDRAVSGARGAGRGSQS